MLCSVMLCYALFCCIMLCYVMLCYIKLCYVILSCVTFSYVMLCYAFLGYAMLCRVKIIRKLVFERVFFLQMISYGSNQWNYLRNMVAMVTSKSHLVCCLFVFQSFLQWVVFCVVLSLILECYTVFWKQNMTTDTRTCQGYVAHREEIWSKGVTCVHWASHDVCNVVFALGLTALAFSVLRDSVCLESRISGVLQWVGRWTLTWLSFKFELSAVFVTIAKLAH